jgi:hypothetical protein
LHSIFYAPSRFREALGGIFETYNARVKISLDRQQFMNYSGASGAGYFEQSFLRQKAHVLEERSYEMF